MIGLLGACATPAQEELVGRPPEPQEEFKPLRDPKHIALAGQDQPKTAAEHQRVVDERLEARARALSVCLAEENSDFQGPELRLRISFILSWQGRLSQLKLGPLPVEAQDPMVPCLTETLEQTVFPYHPDKLETTHALELRIQR